MATIVKLGSLLMDGARTEPEAAYQPGKALSFVDGYGISWIVVNGLLIADHSLLVNISWDDLNNQGLVFGKQITLNGQKLLCRLLKVGKDRYSSNEWDDALNIVGENNNLWSWYGVYFWGQDTPVNHASGRAFRGYNSARLWAWNDSPTRSSRLGFRPILEPIPSEGISPGAHICAIGGQSILRGKLLEITNYDALIQPERSSIFADSDLGKLYIKLNDGTIIIDQHQMVIQDVSSYWNLLNTKTAPS